MVDAGDKAFWSDSQAKILRSGGMASGDITGGLPRRTELFELPRNPSNPAIVSEVDGIVSFW
ncbi:MAG: hypothetical protein R2813_07130 [Flavobacteriales bacterium]